MLSSRLLKEYLVVCKIIRAMCAFYEWERLKSRWVPRDCHGIAKCGNDNVRPGTPITCSPHRPPTHLVGARRGVTVTCPHDWAQGAQAARRVRGGVSGREERCHQWTGSRAPWSVPAASSRVLRTDPRAQGGCVCPFRLSGVTICCLGHWHAWAQTGMVLGL